MHTAVTIVTDLPLGGAPTIAVTGILDSTNAFRLHDALTMVVTLRPADIVLLDLTAVHGIDEAALRVLLVHGDRLRQLGSRPL
ncbi:STAS domain-containing protein [Nocardia sp. NPDC051570]|uniref:STAS domain-containing protein n=1 Tax=Nocardia sp. NPDC051570 TaxID=3364324 RepID=UPI0037A94A34